MITENEYLIAKRIVKQYEKQQQIKNVNIYYHTLKSPHTPTNHP